MATLNDVSNILGEYMLKGWVLTDKSCSVCATPLMRSPRAAATEVWFCAKCDGGPPGSALNAKSKSAAQPSSFTSGTSTTTSSRQSSTDESDTPSTPPTEMSNLSEEFILPPETEESRRRREQSDRASAELGRRLLQGWAMLGEECPNSTCYGVPLMRPPNQGEEMSPNKECVICCNVYITETGPGGERLILLNPPKNETASSSSSTLAQLPTQQVIPRDPVCVPAISNTLQPQTQVVNPELLQVLTETSTNLQSTLHGLSNNLTALTPRDYMNPESICKLANAISDVTQALRHVEQLRRDTQ
ncbi:hypothetical protein CC2G_010621 [Coprinopsis cinerea AmutBmut pab1-1]|nr:hypothetical protein CC2G_010621 [Coprinopsis cinerea AmutBmut pab1-1]